jgi:hypothetical protein
MAVIGLAMGAPESPQPVHGGLAIDDGVVHLWVTPMDAASCLVLRLAFRVPEAGSNVVAVLLE